jgi:tetratricopeptide (TPR) repeat protein
MNSAAWQKVTLVSHQDNPHWNCRWIQVIVLLCFLTLGSPSAFAEMTPKQLSRKIDGIRDILAQGLDQARANYLRFSPGDAFRKKLPSQESVVATKDQQGFKSYGGLSEVYLFEGSEDKATALVDWLTANNATVLGAGDPYLSTIYNDFGLYYFKKKDYDQAESWIKKSLPILENAAQSDAKTYNSSLVSAYSALAVLSFDQDDKKTAIEFIEKLKALTQ